LAGFACLGVVGRHFWFLDLKLSPPSGNEPIQNAAWTSADPIPYGFMVRLTATLFQQGALSFA